MSGYLAGDDKEWLVEEQPRREEPVRRFIDGEGGELDIPGHEGRETGAKAITVGGHFPGSMTAREAEGDEQFCVYVELSEYDTPSPTRTRVRFTAVHGGFPGLDIEDEDVKKRVWESMGIQVGAEAGDRGVGFAEEFGFPNLPVEIQTMIWQHAIHSIPGRDFIIRYSSIPQALQIGPAHGRWTEIISPTWTVIPAVLHTCQLSRLLAQDRWTLDIPSY
ncbi:hypothetical protein GMDG_00716 [Pseudogymnoascus destructans 20631-21]|uniref:2EXR domain-containing protein n=1 Tax=Pseudogymnoascus destructans (strain ATCC MYA-4855 / 20631-21) TaxID=658429 RepID=L8GBD5_PSED2|nr:hypothetical protein GMDG_00716 [Pseudogymnoascus destructans 20631-21]